MLRLYHDWASSNRAVFPYPGSRIAQPNWVLVYFDIFDSVNELMALEKRRPDISGLPTIDQALGAPPES